MNLGHCHYLQALELRREACDFMYGFLPAVPFIHARKFLYVFTCIKNAETWNHNHKLHFGNILFPLTVLSLFL